MGLGRASPSSDTTTTTEGHTVHDAQQMIQEYYNPPTPTEVLMRQSLKKFRVRYVARVSMWAVEYGDAYMAQRQTWAGAMQFVNERTQTYRRVRG